MQQLGILNVNIQVTRLRLDIEDVNAFQIILRMPPKLFDETLENITQQVYQH